MERIDIIWLIICVLCVQGKHSIAGESQGRTLLFLGGGSLKGPHFFYVWTSILNLILDSFFSTGEKVEKGPQCPFPLKAVPRVNICVKEIKSKVFFR